MQNYYRYPEIPYAVANKDEFMGSSSCAVIMTGEMAKVMDYGYSSSDSREKFNAIINGSNNDNIYVVKSYDTPIAMYNMETKEGFVSDDFYSSTTSRLQNICRRSL